MAAYKDKKDSGGLPSKRTRLDLHEVTSERALHHLIPEALLENDVNVPYYYGRTPLHLALQSGCSYETFTIIKEAGAYLGARNVRGINALYFALMGDCELKIINELLDYDWKMIFGNNRTALLLAASKMRLYVLIPVFAKHQRINYRDPDGMTLMHLALRHDCSRSVDSLVKYMSPALLNETDENGNTYLHYAVKEGCSSVIVRALLNAGLNPATKNEDGDNALHFLLRTERCRIISLLKELLRGHPEILQVRDSNGKFLIDRLDYYFSHVVSPAILKWVILQKGADFQWSLISKTPVPHRMAWSALQDCRSELQRLRDFMVTDKLSLYDLVKSCYVSPKFINELRAEDKFVKVLQFENNLVVYEQEVREIIRMVKVCSSLYGKTLPFPAFKNGSFVNISEKVLDYLSIEELEQLAIAINVNK